MALYSRLRLSCQRCRSKKIRCDRAKPNCTQCIMSQNECPGYNNESDSIFRNETTLTIRRAQGLAYFNEKANGMSKLISNPQASAKTNRATPSTCIVKSPSICLKDLASCHFVSNFVLVPCQNQTSTRGFFGFVSACMDKGPLPDHFKFAFDACALALFNNKFSHTSYLSMQGFQSYTKALAATSIALREPRHIKDDVTTATILLLGLFEYVAAAKSFRVQAWLSHLNGAYEVIKARGPQQLRTDLGLDMFYLVRSQVLVHAFSTGLSPKIDLEQWANSYTRDVYESRIYQLSSYTAGLKAKVTSLFSSDPAFTDPLSVQELLQQCSDLEDDLLKWSNTLPTSFGWKTIAWRKYRYSDDFSKLEAFPGPIDIYEDVWTAYLWNMSRCSRILLAAMKIRCIDCICKRSDYCISPTYLAARYACKESISGIVASVPYLLGSTLVRQILAERPNKSDYICGDTNAIKALPGHLLVWPLYFILRQHDISNDQRQWVMGRLQYIGNELGIGYARVLAKTSEIRL